MAIALQGFLLRAGSACAELAKERSDDAFADDQCWLERVRPAVARRSRMAFRNLIFRAVSARVR